MTPRRPRPLCAICADREATTITTTLELIAFLTRHLDCRPPWARKAAP